MSTESDLAQTALELVNEFGGTGQYISIVQGEYDPSTGVVNTEVVQNAKMCLVDLTLQSNGLSLKFGTQVLAGDKEAYVIPPVRTGGTAITINPGIDKVVFGGVTYTVMTFKEANLTGSSPIVFYLYLRR